MLFTTKMYKSDWFKKIFESKPKIVLVAGASSSGKSYVSKELEQYYKEHGKRCKVISADNYYKGIARIIVQKAILNNGYGNVVKMKFKEICTAVKSIIKDTPFPQKMCDENVIKIEGELAKLFDNDFAKKFTSQIKHEFEQINFDEPFAVDLKSLANDINKLIAGKNIVFPEYSFKTGETELYAKNRVNPNNYDTIVVEGIYALLDEVLENIEDPSNTVYSAIDCDLKTLISRKLDRDITKGRSTFTTEQVVISYLTQVIPSYYKYIYPSFKNADYILQTTLTQDEIQSRRHISQNKYLVSDWVHNYLKTTGYTSTKCEQNDYFLEESISNNNIVLRVREEGGKAKSITIKTCKDIDNLDRYVEEYDISNFGEENREIGGLLKKFIDSGFYVSTTIHKERTTYKKDDITIKIDDFEDEHYLELDIDNESKAAYFRLAGELGLGYDINRSYYQIMKDRNVVHKEKENKYVVKGNIKEFVRNNNLAGHVIHQYYLDLTNSGNIEFIEQFVDKKEDLSEFSEARLRFIDGKRCYLTLKSSGEFSRVEYEKEIPISLVNLNKLVLKGSIKKIRYDILKQSEQAVSLDVYLDRDLAVCEAEYFREPMSKREILELLGGLTIQDVTKDQSYKNSNLAK